MKMKAKGKISYLFGEGAGAPMVLKMLFKKTWIAKQVLLFGLTMGMPLPLPAQNLDYTSPSTGVDGDLIIPSPFISGLQNAAMAFDAVNGKIIIFGGVDASDVVVDTTFSFDGTAWNAEIPATVPPARKGARMVFDAARGEIVMFGGNKSVSGTFSGNLFNDTWVWNGTNWTEKIFPDGTLLPAPRWDFSMAYDPVEQKTLLFGGGIGSNITDDTWAWDGTAWTELAPVNNPGVVFQNDMTFDEAAGELVLVGGRTGSTVVDLTMVWNWTQNNWIDRNPVDSPGPRHLPQLVYDKVRGKVVLFGGGTDSSGNTELDDTWLWDGSNGTWTRVFPANKPPKRRFHNMIFNTLDGLTYLFGGEDGNVEKNDVWTWDGITWRQQLGSDFLFDLSPKPDGVFNFSTIGIADGVTVTFIPNEDNTPVVWLATGVVTINGIIDLDGENGSAGTTTVVGQGGTGGPGGFGGGRGGIRQDQSGSFAGQEGFGPGGGTPGIADNQNGQDATHASTYGNPFLQPIVGGSGGGGGASRAGNNASGGGGGGGALVIASSSDIIVSGSITVRGGTGSTSFADGGDGSGGSILLIADRVLGAGSLDAGGGGTAESGRIRVEGVERSLASGANPAAVVGIPLLVREFTLPPRLVITEVAGEPVPQPPSGSFLTPDLFFFNGGPVDIKVIAENIPDGTMVSLRITAGDQTIDSAPQALAAGSVTFSLNVPEGTGAIQASAAFLP